MTKLAAFVLGLALAALTAACAADTTNTNANANLANSNAVNANAANANTANANTRRTYDPDITEADWERERDRFAREAREAGDAIGTGVKDGWLWVKTKGALAAVDDLRDSVINVDVDNGVITLRGNLRSKQEVDAAVKAANAVEGKTRVNNQLKVAAGGNTNNANR